MKERKTYFLIRLYNNEFTARKRLTFIVSCVTMNNGWADYEDNIKTKTDTPSNKVKSVVV